MYKRCLPFTNTCSDGEACRFLESVQDLFFQRERAETVSFESKKNDVAIFKRVPSNKKLNKRDISAPCNFKHVSGIFSCIYNFALSLV